MLNENIKSLRKQKGYTQESLALELNVVRQTVSKWEKGYSVPDALMMEKLAALFEVSVGELLGDEPQKAEQKADLQQLSEQLAVLSSQYAKELARRKRNRKILLIVAGIIFVILLIGVVISFHSFEQYEAGSDQTVSGIVNMTLEPALDEAVSQAILSEHSLEYSSGECMTESHYVFGSKEKGDTVKVYLLEDYTGFGFCNGFFCDVSGGKTPVVLTFQKKGDSYSLRKRETADDGAAHTSSVKKLFASRYAKKILQGLTDEEMAQMWNTQVQQAQRYLDSIHRKATICLYSDIQMTFLFDCGVAEKVVSTIADNGLEYNTYIGNHEMIENDKRYVYQTAYEQNSDSITFTKFEYDTDKVVEYLAFDAETGAALTVTSVPEKAVYYQGELQEGA